MAVECWKKVKREAEERICALFDDCKTNVRFKDARDVLAHVLKHGDCREKACAILSFGEWIHAVHELEAHGAESAAS